MKRRSCIAVDMRKDDLILQDLKKNLSEKRYKHSLGTATACKELAVHWGYDEDKAYLAGLVHDCCKYKDNNLLFEDAGKFESLHQFMGKEYKEVLHAKLGAIIAKERYNIYDKEILDAISFHANGRENMSLLEKIVLVADKTEKNRTYEGVENLRKLAFLNLDKSVLEICADTIRSLVATRRYIVNDTVSAYNYYIKLGD